MPAVKIVWRSDNTDEYATAWDRPVIEEGSEPASKPVLSSGKLRGRRTCDSQSDRIALMFGTHVLKQFPGIFVEVRVRRVWISFHELVFDGVVR